MWQSGESPTNIVHIYWHPPAPTLPVTEPKLAFMYLAISWHCHSSWKPTAHPRVLENAEKVVKFLFLKHCSLSLSYLFFSWLWGGLPEKLLLAWVHLPHSACMKHAYFSRPFYIPQNGSHQWEFVHQVRPSGGKVVLQRSQWASSGALLVSTMAPYIRMADDVMLSLENGPKWYVH